MPGLMGSPAQDTSAITDAAAFAANRIIVVRSAIVWDGMLRSWNCKGS